MGCAPRTKRRTKTRPSAMLVAIAPSFSGLDLEWLGTEESRRPFRDQIGDLPYADRRCSQEYNQERTQTATRNLLIGPERTPQPSLTLPFSPFIRRLGSRTLCYYETPYFYVPKWERNAPRCTDLCRMKCRTHSSICRRRGIRRSNADYGAENSTSAVCRRPDPLRASIPSWRYHTVSKPSSTKVFRNV